MTSSGTWLPARAVIDACNLRMAKYIGDWRARRERDIDLLVDRGRWSWLQWRQVPLTRQEAENASMTVGVIDWFIESPMNHDGYAATAHLLSLAAQAEKLHAGSQVFVSADDHYRISGALQGILNNGNHDTSAVPGDGNRHNGDGEHGS